MFYSHNIILLYISQKEFTYVNKAACIFPIHNFFPGTTQLFIFENKREFDSEHTGSSRKWQW